MTDEFEPSEAEVREVAQIIRSATRGAMGFARSETVARDALRAAARVRGTNVAISDLCADEIADAYARGRRDEKGARRANRDLKKGPGK